MFPPAMTYAAIAREEAAIVERTGLLGEGGAWAGRQMVARFFIDGFGTAEQRGTWRAQLASVAISEPRVGAHPKLLTTRAEEVGDGYCIFGEKAWERSPRRGVHRICHHRHRGRPQALQRVPGAA
jgi:acyl-CoA dehydrogenase